MRGALARFILVTGGALLAPLFASAHGSDFLLAKLSISPGDVRLEITADCEGNPMIADTKQAAGILPSALQMQVDGANQPLASFSEVRMEERSQFDETAPLPPGTFDNSVSHQLLTSVWQWQPDRESIQFTVPKDSKHDVLLWVVDPAMPNAEPRWMMLLGGDVTPPIPLPMRRWWEREWWMVGGGVALIAMLLPVSRIFLRRSRQ